MHRFEARASLPVLLIRNVHNGFHGWHSRLPIVSAHDELGARDEALTRLVEPAARERRWREGGLVRNKARFEAEPGSIRAGPARRPQAGLVRRPGDRSLRLTHGYEQLPPGHDAGRADRGPDYSGLPPNPAALPRGCQVANLLRSLKVLWLQTERVLKLPSCSIPHDIRSTSASVFPSTKKARIPPSCHR
jgi:hypothetical protein